jgi:uncharacterized protein YgbK (DUF1537 family)
VKTVKIAIIADDLTGANDTGVHLAKRGLSTSVLLDVIPKAMSKYEAVVFDTDSRSQTGEEACRRVTEVCRRIQRENDYDFIYKKIDSTLRGNIGHEMDAMYEVFQPDFIVVAPSFPKLGRVVRDGLMYVNGVPIHMTDTARDPKNPVMHSSVRMLLEQQTARPIAVITGKEMGEGNDALLEQIERYRQKDIPYLVFDAETEDDLLQIVSLFTQSRFRVIWAGSSGLANELSEQLFIKKRNAFQHLPVPGPVLVLVGSVSTNSRLQLEVVLRRSDVTGIEMKTEAVLTEEAKRQELKRIAFLAADAYCADKKDVVLYSSGLPEDVERSRLVGAQHGLSTKQVSSAISGALGEAAGEIVKAHKVRNLVLTGGETAKQLCRHLGAEEIELIDEVETGVPLGRLTGHEDIYVITKAGGFGSEAVLERSLEIFRGGTVTWNRSLG